MMEFRLYDDEGDFFYYATMEELMDCSGAEDFRGAYAEYVRENKKPPIDRFSGFKDWTGAKIFEGDIYHQGDKNIKYKVIFKDGAFIGSQIGNESLAGLLHFINDIEVVGNIHQQEPK